MLGVSGEPSDAWNKPVEDRIEISEREVAVSDREEIGGLWE